MPYMHGPYMYAQIKLAGPRMATTIFTTCTKTFYSNISHVQIKLAGPRMATTIVPKNQLPLLVRRIMIDADVTAMIARNGELGYSSNWQVTVLRGWVGGGRAGRLAGRQVGRQEDR